MKPKNFLLAVLSFLIIAFSSSESFSVTKFSKTEIFRTSVSIPGDSNGEYTYVRVFKDGKWWIAVYNDQGVLVDEYSEV